MRLRYVLSEVMVGLWRNVTMTTPMIITMAVSLTLLGASLLLYKQVDRMKEVYNEEVEVSMFFSAEGATPEEKFAPPEQKAAIESQLRNDPLVDRFSFENKDQAYEKFKVLFASPPDLVELTKSESLPESYRVKLKDPNTFEQFQVKYEKFISPEGGLELI